MEKNELGLLIGLSLAGLLIFLITLTVLLLLRRRKNSEKSSTKRVKKDKNVKKEKKNYDKDESKNTTLNTRCDDSCNTSAISDLPFHGESNFWNNKKVLNSQFGNSSTHNSSIQSLAQQQTLKVRFPSKNRDVVNVNSSERNQSAVGMGENDDVMVEKEWKSAVDDIFNSALSLHEHTIRASVYPTS